MGEGVEEPQTALLQGPRESPLTPKGDLGTRLGEHWLLGDPIWRAVEDSFSLSSGFSPTPLSAPDFGSQFATFSPVA